MELTDDTLLLFLYINHCEIGNVGIFETGVELTITGGELELSAYCDGIVVKDGDKVLTVDSIEFCMDADPVGGTTVYNIFAGRATLNDEEVNQSLAYTITQSAGSTTIDGSALFLNLDLTGDGIRLSDTKVLKGTAMVTDGVVGVNLYLNTPDSGSHIKIDGNSSVDICFHDSIGTSDKIDAEFKADSNGVVRDLKIPSFGTTFKLGNVAFDEETDTLTIGTFEITGEGSDAAEF